jgi:Domain of unknown function (DUF4382)
MRCELRWVLDSHLRRLSLFRDHLIFCLLACIALAACQPQTNVSATGNVPVQYQHVWVTMNEVAFNTSATAGPADTTWTQFTLPSPQTIDLASFTNGALAQFASSLKLSEGTYNQMRITMTDANASVTSSAQAAGASFNDEVDYTDASGALHRLPLQVPNAAQGVAFPVSLTVVSAQQAGIAALACASMSGNSSTGNASALLGGSFNGSTNCAFGGQTKADCVQGQFFDSLGSCITVGTTSGLGTTSGIGTTTGSTSSITCPAGTTYDSATGTCTSTLTSGPTSCAAGTTYDSATGTCVASNTTNFASTCTATQTYNPTTGTCSGSLTAATTSLAITFDASRDIAPYLIGGQPGFVLIPHAAAAYNLAQAGSIAGSVNIAGLPATTGGIEVTAETLSSDGSRHVIVESAPVSNTGSFVLYPLPATTTAASYTTSTTCPSGETYDSASGTCVTTASSTEQYDLVIHGPGIATVIIAGVPVSSGNSAASSTLSFGVTLTPATSFAVQLASGSTVSPAGAYVGFYQTIPSSGEVPYLIEAYPVDPFTGAFDTAQYLSTADLQYGAYVSGGVVALTDAAPAEGAGAYHVAASAPLYGDGPLSTTVVAPATATASATPFTVAAIPLPSGTTAGSIAGTVTVAAPGKYDKGELLLTQNGALLAVAPLDSYLAAAQSSATLFSSVPTGGSGSVSNTNQFFAEAWVWNSSNPSGTLSRQPVSSAIDLSSGSASGVTIAIE